jgi:hypothetical protein
MMNLIIVLCPKTKLVLYICKHRQQIKAQEFFGIMLFNVFLIYLWGSSGVMGVAVLTADEESNLDGVYQAIY